MNAEPAKPFFCVVCNTMTDHIGMNCPSRARPDPWHNQPAEKWSKEKEAHKAGKRIQVRGRWTPDGEWQAWEDIRDPSWVEGHESYAVEYRIAPDQPQTSVEPNEPLEDKCCDGLTYCIGGQGFRRFCQTCGTECDEKGRPMRVVDRNEPLAPPTKGGTPKYWFCVVGPLPDSAIPWGADFPPRNAVRSAIEAMTGLSTVACTTSAWVNEDEALAIKGARYTLATPPPPTDKGEAKCPTCGGFGVVKREMSDFQPCPVCSKQGEAKSAGEAGEIKWPEFERWSRHTSARRAYDEMIAAAYAQREAGKVPSVEEMDELYHKGCVTTTLFIPHMDGLRRIHDALAAKPEVRELENQSKVYLSDEANESAIRDGVALGVLTNEQARELLGKDIMIPTSKDCEMASLGETIYNHFSKQGIEDWQLGHIASRSLVWKLESRLAEAVARANQEASDAAMMREALEKIAKLGEWTLLCNGGGNCGHDDTVNCVIQCAIAGDAGKAWLDEKHGLQEACDSFAAQEKYLRELFNCDAETDLQTAAREAVARAEKAEKAETEANRELETVLALGNELGFDKEQNGMWNIAQIITHVRYLQQDRATQMKRALDAENDLLQIESLLPDDSPCKHEETGHSLYDDIDALVRQRDGLKNTYNEIFGILYAAKMHGGTVQDGVRKLVEERDAFKLELKQIRDFILNLQSASA